MNFISRLLGGCKLTFFFFKESVITNTCATPARSATNTRPVGRATSRTSVASIPNFRAHFAHTRRNKKLRLRCTSGVYTKCIARHSVQGLSNY